MELYVYETPGGGSHIADFRPYLDGRDHSFDDHRALSERDPRWEKIDRLLDPVTREGIGGALRFVGRAEVKWRELEIFPVAWSADYESVGWDAEA